MLELHMANFIEEVDLKEKHLLEVAMMVKRMMERKMVVDYNLQLSLQQMCEL